MMTGVDVNLSDYAGWTPLHEACHRGHMECVRLLLNYRPMKNITSYFKSSMFLLNRRVYFAHTKW